MPVDWVTAMDMCASAGIINYDAPAAILGQTPRYFGHPNIDSIPSLNGPLSDTYDTDNHNMVRPKDWKRTAMKTLIGIGATLGIVKLIQKGILNVTNIKKVGKAILNIFKKPSSHSSAAITPGTTP